MTSHAFDTSAAASYCPFMPVFGPPAVMFERGRGTELWDSQGKRYLDFLGGLAVTGLGHAHPVVTDAICAQAATLTHVSNLFANTVTTQAALTVTGLLREVTGHDGQVFFCNSGAEANEGAFKFARRYGRAHGGDGKVEILAFSNAFHGRTMGALSATPRPKYQDPFKPLMPGVRFAEFNDLASARAQMDESVCAIVVEPLQGEGGIHAATPEFLAGLRALADEFDALLIYDEVQCGVGRTGTLWAHQGYCKADDTCASGDGCKYEPDILTAAKPLAAGLPIGAILMRQRVADTIHKGDHGSTFAGGPLVTHVAHHVVGRVAQPEFLAEVDAKGKLLRDLLEEINSPHVLEIRGKGLMVGLELDIEAAEVVTRGYEQGLILVNAGPNVLRLVPPLVITEDEIHEVAARLARVLHAL